LLTLHVDGIIFGTGAQGGIRRVFRNLLEGLAARADVHMRLCLPPNAPTVAFAGNAVEVVRYPTPVRLRPSRLFARLNGQRQERAMARMWEKARSGVFHSTYYSTSGSLGVPQLLTMQDAIYEEFPACFSPEKWTIHTGQKAKAVAAADTVVFPSESARAATGRFYDLGRKRTVIIPYAVDSVFQPADGPTPSPRHTDGRPYILFVGRRSGHKNFEGLVRAYARWNGRTSFTLLAVGGGAPSPTERELNHSLGIEHLVRFASTVGDADLVCLYQGATALIVPALSEGYGLPVVEGMACGTPVAASHGGSLREVGGECPIYFDATDEDDLRRALEEVVSIDRQSDRVLRGVAVSRARRWDHVAEEYLAAYRETAG
jgi:glycosyltransferase involved in cell wall biosynthesis